jgi:hypothetical protein
MLMSKWAYYIILKHKSLEVLVYILLIYYLLGTKSQEHRITQ